MACVVTKKCTKSKACIAVCPVDAFHEDAGQLVINPETCISCGACISECPVQAIYMEDEVPEEYKDDIAANAEKSKSLPQITAS